MWRGCRHVKTGLQTTPMWRNERMHSSACLCVIARAAYACCMDGLEVDSASHTQFCKAYRGASQLLGQTSSGSNSTYKAGLSPLLSLRPTPLVNTTHGIYRKQCCLIILTYIKSSSASCALWWPDRNRDHAPPHIISLQFC